MAGSPHALRRAYAQPAGSGVEDGPGRVQHAVIPQGTLAKARPSCPESPPAARPADLRPNCERGLIRVYSGLAPRRLAPSRARQWKLARGASRQREKGTSRVRPDQIAQRLTEGAVLDGPYFGEPVRVPPAKMRAGRVELSAEGIDTKQTWKQLFKADDFESAVTITSTGGMFTLTDDLCGVRAFSFALPGASGSVPHGG